MNLLVCVYINIKCTGTTIKGLSTILGPYAHTVLSIIFLGIKILFCVSVYIPYIDIGYL